jgi:hypothetical protein
VTLWTTSFDDLSSSDVSSEGEGAVGALAQGWGTLQSVPLSLPAFSSISFDVLLSTEQANPYWLGYAEVVLHAPSAGIYDQYVGQANFAGLTLGEYQTLTISLPPWVAPAFAGPTEGVSIRIVLNVPYNAPDAVLLDNRVLY